MITFECQRDDLEYQFFYNWNDRGWLPLTYSFSKDNTLSWTPTKNGKYIILACIREVANPQNYLETIIQYQVVDHSYIYPTLKDVIIDPELKAVIAVPGADNVNVKYKFIAGETATSMKVLQEGTNPYCNWYPTKSGVYNLMVQVYEKGSNILEDQIVKEINIPYKYEKKYGSIRIRDIQINSSKTENGKIYINTPINLQVEAEGGKQLLYSFSVYNGIGWQLLQDYSKYSVLRKDWTPAQKGIYILQIKIKDSSSGSYEDLVYKTVEIIDHNLKNITSDGIQIQGDFEKRSIQKIFINVDGIDTPLYEFSFSSKNYGREVIQSFSPLNTCVWIPKKEGDYVLTVRIKDYEAGSFEREYQRNVQIQ